MRALDSHLHLWDPALLRYDWLSGPLAGAFGAGELRTAPVGDTPAAVFVQAGAAYDDALAEVAWVSGFADAAGVRGVVGDARLDRGTATTAHLDELGAHPLVVGVRHLLQGEPDGLAATPAFVAGAREVAARGWRFDACVRAHQIPDVASLAEQVPELPIVLDHLGKPAVGTADAPVAPTAEWLRDISALARHPHVSCKLSGLPAEAGGLWDAAQLAPFLDAVAEAFGPERLMWGSDWPVSAVDAEYRPGARARWLDTVAAWVIDRGLDADAILWTNGARFYGVD